MSRTIYLATTLMLITQAGCATMRMEQVPSTERIVAARQAEENGSQVKATVLEDGPSIRLRVDTDCQLQGYDRVETTEHFAAANQNAWVDWTAGIGGAGLVGFGAYALVDSSKTYSNDTSSRTFNSAGPGADTALAITSFAGGAALLTIAAIDIVRAQHHEEKSSLKEQRGRLGGSCGMKPLGNATVRLHLVGQQELSGTTDSSGNVQFDAGLAVNALEAENGKATLIVEGRNPELSLDLPRYAEWQRGRAIALVEKKKAIDAALQRELDAEAMSRIETSSAEIERLVTKLERTKGPWGSAEIEDSTRVVELFRDTPGQIESLRRSPNLPAPLLARATAMTPWFQRLPKRIEALMPRLERVVALRKKQNEQEAAAMMRGRFSGESNAAPSVRSADESDARARDAEERHQRERADDERRHQEERADDKSQQEREQRANEWKRSQDRARCLSSCEDRKNACYEHCIAHKPASWTSEGCPGTMYQPCIDAQNACNSSCR